MAWKTYFGFLIILLVKETVTEDLCKVSPDAVSACKTVVDVKRQLFIPINNTIGDGCQCTVKMVSTTEDSITDLVETKFLNTSECGFNVSTELNGVLETLTCSNKLVTKEVTTGDEMIYRFTGRSNATVCLQIVPQDSKTGIHISCADQFTEPNTAPTTDSKPTTSSASPSTGSVATQSASSTASPATQSASSTVSPATQSASSSGSQATQSASSTGSSAPQSATNSQIQAESSSHTSSASHQQTTTLASDDTDVNGPKSTTIKPKKDEPDIAFIIILIGSCVGGFLIILLIILITWCIIYRRRKKRLETKEALPYNETDRHSLEGIQVENELFILAYKGKEESKQTDVNEESHPSLGDQLPDIVKPSENKVKKVNFDVRDPTEELPEESVTEFKTDTISVNDEAVNAMAGRIQL